MRTLCCCNTLAALPWMAWSLVVITLNPFQLAAAESRPKVWIYTDMSDKTIPGPNGEGTVNDPDDISAMAGYLLMGNEFETLGIVVTSTHRSQHRNSQTRARGPTHFSAMPTAPRWAT